MRGVVDSAESDPEDAVWGRRIVGGAMLLAAVAMVLGVAAAWFVHAWLSGPPLRHASAELAALQADPGVNLVPPGATVAAMHSNDTCSDWFDQTPPQVWRDFTYSGEDQSFLDFYRTSLPERGWQLNADFLTANATVRVLNFSRSFGRWDARIIISQRELIAEVSSPSYC